MAVMISCFMLHFYLETLIKAPIHENTFQDWALRDYSQIFIMDKPVNSVNLFCLQFFWRVQAVLMSCPKADFIHFYPGVILVAPLNYDVYWSSSDIQIILSRLEKITK